MLHTIGVSRVEELFADMDSRLILKEPLKLPKALSELELVHHISSLAQNNTQHKISFLGAGCYNHFIPATVDAVTSRSEFYTSYTPYQPEISQGNLQAIFEYQTMICELTGMDAANASHYDGATALAEAALMCVRVTGKDEIILSKAVHPHYREVIHTYCRASNIVIREAECEQGITDPEKSESLLNHNTACILVQNPNFFGLIEKLDYFAKQAHSHQALCVACITDPTSLGLLKPPGDYNIDIVAAEGQSFGNSQNYGGPHLGIMACGQEYVRKLPGRLVGMTEDNKGERGFVLTLQAREQHIRRQGATSNICSNQALCALAAAVYLATLGPYGLRQIAGLNTERAHYMCDQLIKMPGFDRVFQGPFYNEFVIKCKNISEVQKKLAAAAITGGCAIGSFYPALKDCLLFCVTEMHTKHDIDTTLEVLA
jgi:glycine dehydrogenase subunit 1